jgi:hypothetical protein
MVLPLLCALVLNAPTGDASPARLGLDEIIRGIEANEKAWRAQGSWMVRYVHSRERIDPPPGSLVLYPDNRLTNARKGPWMFAREEQSEEEGRLKTARNPGGGIDQGRLVLFPQSLETSKRSSSERIHYRGAAS